MHRRTPPGGHCGTEEPSRWPQSGGWSCRSLGFELQSPKPRGSRNPTAAKRKARWGPGRAQGRGDVPWGPAPPPAPLRKNQPGLPSWRDTGPGPASPACLTRPLPQGRTWENTQGLEGAVLQASTVPGPSTGSSQGLCDLRTYFSSSESARPVAADKRASAAPPGLPGNPADPGPVGSGKGVAGRQRGERRILVPPQILGRCHDWLKGSEPLVCQPSGQRRPKTRRVLPGSPAGPPGAQHWFPGANSLRWLQRGPAALCPPGTAPVSPESKEDSFSEKRRRRHICKEGRNPRKTWSLEPRPHKGAGRGGGGRAGPQADRSLWGRLRGWRVAASVTVIGNSGQAGIQQLLGPLRPVPILGPLFRAEVHPGSSAPGPCCPLLPTSRGRCRRAGATSSQGHHPARQDQDLSQDH
ncbi:collagen alpha-1(III) chain [Marmota monax]|uniref:collagen alpha-1(III) chain n=1 Tax=Marmota monax TaxID=9995 RepID=UPI001EAFDC24|nr:collagen alpha-1(III) chain [Marmota monax]